MHRIRRTRLSLAAVGLLALAACAPVPKTVDTPKDGDAISLGLKQPMQVRWGNQRPDRGSWVVEKDPKSVALAMIGQSIQPPGEGAQQVEIFDFVGSQKGSEALIFTFKRKDGQPPTVDERVTIDVTVG